MKQKDCGLGRCTDINPLSKPSPSPLCEDTKAVHPINSGAADASDLLWMRAVRNRCHFRKRAAGGESPSAASRIAGSGRLRKNRSFILVPPFLAQRHGNNSEVIHVAAVLETGDQESQDRTDRTRQHGSAQAMAPPSSSRRIGFLTRETAPSRMSGWRHAARMGVVCEKPGHRGMRIFQGFRKRCPGNPARHHP